MKLIAALAFLTIAAQAQTTHITVHNPTATPRPSEVLDLPLADGLRLERELYDWLQGTEDAREGAHAFTEKRPPRWQSC